MSEKTEKPTSKKRKDSEKKGQTLKSKDLTITIILVMGIFYLSMSMNFNDFTSLYSQVLLNTNAFSVDDFLFKLAFVFLKIATPFIAVCCAAGLMTTLLQTRFTIAIEALKINFKALNPVEGFKKIFSLRTIKELVKSIMYLVAFIYTSYHSFYTQIKDLILVHNVGLPSLIYAWISITTTAVFSFILCAILLVAFDFITEYFLYIKDLKMDKHEVKNEHKESEGDPKIKHARRDLHREILSGEEMAAIRNSEVVMANPTHIAIAIYFNPEVASLPFIALRCTNQKARAAIAYAEKIGVPVVRSIPLTRRIYKTYKQHSFISINDDGLMDVIDILIWLKQVESAGVIEPLPETEDVQADDKPADEQSTN